MTPTRYSPEQLQSEADLYHCEDCEFEDQPEISWSELSDLADMIRQAASDARVLAQLRTWLETQQKACFPQDIGVVMAYRATLAELDRLTQPTETP